MAKFHIISSTAYIFITTISVYINYNTYSKIPNGKRIIEPIIY